MGANLKQYERVSLADARQKSSQPQPIQKHVWYRSPGNILIILLTFMLIILGCMHIGVHHKIIHHLHRHHHHEPNISNIKTTGITGKPSGAKVVLKDPNQKNKEASKADPNLPVVKIPSVYDRPQRKPAVPKRKPRTPPPEEEEDLPQDEDREYDYSLLDKFNGDEDGESYDDEDGGYYDDEDGDPDEDSENMLSQHGGKLAAGGGAVVLGGALIYALGGSITGNLRGSADAEAEKKRKR